MMLLSSCNIYRNYTRPSEVTTAGMYRDTLSSSDTLRGDTISIGIFLGRRSFVIPICKR